MANEEKRDYGQAENGGQAVAISLQILADIMRKQVDEKNYSGLIYHSEIMLAGAQTMRSYALRKQGIDTWDEDMILMTALHKVCDINKERDKKRKEENVERERPEVDSADKAN